MSMNNRSINSRIADFRSYDVAARSRRDRPPRPT